MKNDKYLVIHGHFYQPPRENPWLEEIELQESAHPFHNWNERITAECYMPNCVSRIADEKGRILQVVNNYEFLSFNFGPTLLSWLEKYKPDNYKKILEADKVSMEKYSGHGNAIAQVYNHMIMPLSNEKDRITQTIWGIRDFEYRFGRKPEGIWLAETAVDDMTLEIIRKQGIKFTILSPHQAQSVRRLETKDFQDVSWGSIDPSMPYRYFLKDGSGEYIDIFFYDGAISKSVAFDELLKDGQKFVNRLNDGYVADRGHVQLVNIATDGESYGHHTKFGDMALSYIFAIRAEDAGFQLTNYGEFLEKFPPTHEVIIKNNSAWSCSHGVGRWECDCGCSTGGGLGWNQKWRTPLRKALNYLRDEFIILCEIEGQKYFNNFWDARNGYIDVILNRCPETLDAFFEKHEKKKLNSKERITAIKLLELQRQAMLMYTSCGWFFSEISGIETVQIMKYALMAMDLAKDFSTTNYEKQFLAILEQAQSNIPNFGSGKDIFEKFVIPSRINLQKIINHWANLSVYEGYEEISSLYFYDFQVLKSKLMKNKDSSKLFVGKLKLTSQITGEKEEMIFALLRTKEYESYCVSSKLGEKDYNKIKDKIVNAFKDKEYVEVLNTFRSDIDETLYTLKDVLIDKRKTILKKSIGKKLADMGMAYETFYESSKASINYLMGFGMDVPEAFKVSAKYTLVRKLVNALENTTNFSDEEKVKEIQAIKIEADNFNMRLKSPKISELISKKLLKSLQNLTENLNQATADETFALFKTIDFLGVNFEIGAAQDLYYENIYKKMDVILDHLKNSTYKAQDRLLIHRLLDIGEFLKINTEFYRPLVDRASLPNR